MEVVVRKKAARTPPSGNVLVHEDVSRSLSDYFGGGRGKHVGLAAKTVREEQGIGVAVRRY